MSIGKNIQNLRIQRGLSQKELAVIAGVTDKSVSAWEKDRIIPRMGPIQRMADYFGVRKSDIIEPIPVTVNFDTSRKIYKNTQTLSVDEKKLISDYRSLDLFKQQTIINILAFLKQQPENIVAGVVQNNKNGHNVFNANSDNSDNVVNISN